MKKIAKGYNANLHYGDLFDDKYMLLRFQRNVGFLKEKILTQSKTIILDVGGYSGDNYEVMKGMGLPIEKVEYNIVDYDDDALAIARKRGCKGFKFDINFDAISDIVGKKKFDVVICTEVLEHVIDPHKHLKSFAKLLKPNGICIISLPNENSIFHRIYALTGIGIDQCAFELYKHFHFPTIKQARDLVGTYFMIEDFHYYINFGGKRTRFEAIGKIMQLVPDSVWYAITNLFPGLLSRGTIFKLRQKKYNYNS